tara:strand:+ start:1590 stop:2639 length:1050 start_codon:yes stop_codon:yes gene_type:complete
MDYIEPISSNNNSKNEIELLKRKLRNQTNETIKLANQLQVIKLNNEIKIKRLEDIRKNYTSNSTNLNKPIRISVLIDNDNNIENQNNIFFQEKSRDFEALMKLERSILNGQVIASRRNILHFFNDGEFSLDLLNLQKLDKNLRSPNTLFLLKCAIDNSPYNSYSRITHDGQNRNAIRNLTWKKYSYAQYFETIFQNPKQLLDNAIRIDPGRVAFLFFKRVITIFSQTKMYVSNFEGPEADYLMNELYNEFLGYERLKQLDWNNYEYRWINEEIVEKVLQNDWYEPLLLLQKCFEYFVDSSERYTWIINTKKDGSKTFKRTKNKKYLSAAANDVYFASKILEILECSDPL